MKKSVWMAGVAVSMLLTMPALGASMDSASHNTMSNSTSSGPVREIPPAGRASGGSAGAASMSDDTYCGTPTPGHPHAVACTNSMAVHANTMGSATGGAGSGRASMSDDDTYCGTHVPGHPHVNSMGSMQMHSNTMAGGTMSGHTMNCRKAGGTQMNTTMQGGAMTH